MREGIKKVALYAFLLRVPILMAALLWPILPWAFSNPLFRGLADLGSGGDVGEAQGLFGVAFLAFWLIVSAIVMAGFIARYGTLRLSERPPQISVPADNPRLRWWFAGLGLLVYSLFLWSLRQTNRNTMRALTFWTIALLGAGMAVLFVIGLRSRPGAMLALVRAHALHGPPVTNQGHTTGTESLVRFIGPGIQWLGLGFWEFDAAGTPRAPLPGSGSLAAVFTWGIVWGILSLFGKNRDLFPTLYWVLLIGGLSLTAIAILAYWLDRYHAPVTLVLTGLFAVVSLLIGSDSFYDTHPLRTDSPPLLTPSDVLQRPRFKPRLILVAAAGGGIHAAGWTARVLTGLKEDLGERFDNRIAVISGVSGGSVGSFFYLRSLRGYPREPLMPEEAFNDVVKSSLETVALHFFFPFVGNRGQALEQSIAGHAEARGASLHELAKNVSTNFPVVIFNATMAESARPLVFSNSAFPDDSQEIDSLRGGMRGFDQQCANQDINVETAVRMSATFPFVSPAARAHLDCLSSHLVDGGYYDNSGITALNTWLRQGVGKAQWEKDLNWLPEILLLQIVSFPKNSDPAPGDEHWLYQLTAPIEAMLSVRGMGQNLRNQAESWAIMKNVNKPKPRIHTLVFRYAPDDCACSSKQPSLSWHLSPSEIGCLRTAWQEERMKPCRAAVRRFINPAIEYHDSLVCQE